MRIFHIPTKYNFAYRNSIAQILYVDCQNITIKRRALLAEYKSGKKERFIYIPGRERKKIKTLLNEVSLQGTSSPMLQRTHLCPRCTNLLIEGQYTCPNCSLAFKNKKKARKVSIIYPGGGYFYTRHPLIGLGDALTETYLSLLVIAALIATITGKPEGVPALVIFCLMLILEKAISAFHSSHFVKEFIPEDRIITQSIYQPQPQQPPKIAKEPKPEEILSASWRTS